MRGAHLPACHALPVGNVTLPTPVFLAGGAFCLLAGYLVGAVVGPETQHGTTATVVSFESGTSRLCLEGDSVKDETSISECVVTMICVRAEASARSRPSAGIRSG